jgi:hypothetical protein
VGLLAIPGATVRRAQRSDHARQPFKARVGLLAARARRNQQVGQRVARHLGKSFQRHTPCLDAHIAWRVYQNHFPVGRVDKTQARLQGAESVGRFEVEPKRRQGRLEGEMGQPRRADDLDSVGRGVHNCFQHGFNRAAAGHEAHGARPFGSGCQHCRARRLPSRGCPGTARATTRSGAFTRVAIACSGSAGHASKVTPASASTRALGCAGWLTNTRGARRRACSACSLSSCAPPVPSPTR